MHGIVGRSNECHITVNHHLIPALLDTGSTVSTMCYGKYSELFSDVPIISLEEFTLDIEGAGGHKLPYTGYIEVEVAIPGVTDPVNCLVLITPDTNYGQNIPVIIGTNVLDVLMDATEHRHGQRYQQTVKMPDALYFAFRCMKIQKRQLDRSDGQLGIIKCAMTRKVIIPSNRTMVVNGLVDKNVTNLNSFGVIQPLSQSALPNGVGVTPTLVSMNDKSNVISVQVCNLSAGPVVISPNCKLGQIQACELETKVPEFEGQAPDVHSADLSHLEQLRLPESSLNPDQMSQVQELLIQYADVFSKNDMDVGFTGLVKHRILLNDAHPFKQRHRRIPPSMYSEVRNHIKQLLDTNVIRKSHSPWASNIVLVRKKDSSLRLCVDYRQLNLLTIKDAYALPRIEELLDNLGGNKFYSVMDMKSGYHQVGIEEDQKEYTAFTAGPLGLYEYNCLPFGLSNAPATYQRLMEECLECINGEEEQFCQIYLDDVILASKSFTEHLNHLQRVLERFRIAGMKLSPKKCHMFQERVSYVGHTVSSEGVEANDDKILKIKTWPVPCNVDEVRTFLGFTGYYRRFVKDYAKIARPLNDLLGKCTKKRRKGGPRKPSTSDT